MRRSGGAPRARQSPEPPAEGASPAPEDEELATGEQEDARPSAARGGRRPKTLGQVLATIGAVIAALVGAASLIDWVSGKLSDPPPPPTIGASILEVERQDPQLLRDYLNDTSQSRGGYTREQLRQRGLVFAVTLRIRGERGSRFPLRFFMVDADRGTRLRGPSYDQEPAIFEPRNEDQTRTWPVWVPNPLRGGSYRVTFVLDNAKGEPVAQKVTAPFRVGEPGR